MRLLVGLPADRQSELAQNWQIDGAGETVLAVALYRCMTDGAALALVIARLGDAERLIFQHLMRLRRFVSEGELLQALPFSEEQLTDALAALERLGLVWLGPPNPRADGERTWIVPNDLARALSVARHPPAAGRVLAQPSATRPSLMRFPLPVRPNVASDVVVDLIGSLGSSAVQCRDVRPETPVPAERAALDLAKRLGIGLGVWEKVSWGFRPAARYLHWQEATRLERRRAVARLWLVEERVPRAERPLRRALWDALRDAEPEQWYDVNSVARVLAWQLGPSHGRLNELLGESQAGGLRAITRRDLESVLVDLTWLGILRTGTNHLGRIVAIQVTQEGKQAIEEA